jgi:hypothetical protein
MGYCIELLKACRFLFIVAVMCQYIDTQKAISTFNRFVLAQAV